MQVRTIARWGLAISLAGAAGCNVGEGGRSQFGGAEGDSTGAADLGADGSTGADEADESSRGGAPVGGDDGSPTDAYLEEAKKEFPTYLDLHEKVIKRTCSPNGGVCHNKKEYPDLHTPDTMLSMIDVPCNLAETDPLNLFDGCEPAGDHLRFVTGGNLAFSSEVAYVVLHDDGMGTVTNAVIYLRDAIPAAMAMPGVFESVVFERATGGGMLTVGQVDDAVSYAPGMNALQVNDFAALPDATRTLLESEVRGGDPNRNGTFGNEDPYRMLLPGDARKSYLLQRLQGNVPGSPMPLANQPLSTPEILAIACWIEGAVMPAGAGTEASSDYDNCDYAAEFGETPSGSGTTFSGAVQPIFDARCAAGGCHGDVAPAAGLDLTQGKAYDALMQASLQNPDVPRVTPGNPTNSYLMTKLVGNGLQGVQMPLAATPLGPEELDVIRTWISYGAPND